MERVFGKSLRVYRETCWPNKRLVFARPGIIASISLSLSLPSTREGPSILLFFASCRDVEKERAFLPQRVATQNTHSHTMGRAEREADKKTGRIRPISQTKLGGHLSVLFVSRVW